MHQVYTIRRDLIATLGSSPRLEDLRTLFEARTAEYPFYSLEVEGGGIDTFADLFQELKPHEAFALIPSAVDLALEQADPVLFETALYILTGLARASGTTDAPERLARSWSALAEREERLLEGRYRILRYLLEWYRVASPVVSKRPAAQTGDAATERQSPLASQRENMEQQQCPVEGMTANERLHAAGLMAAFDLAARQRDRAAMHALLERVQLSSAEAAVTTDLILASPGRYGY